MISAVKNLLLSKEIVYNVRWQYSFKKKYGSPDQSAFPQNLRLILGLGRSGTTWIANTLARTQTPSRYFEEPLYHIDPKLQFSKKHDHTAIPFQERLGNNHRLKTAYLFFSSKNLPADFLQDKFYRRKDHDFEIVLIKEVHSLLSTEALLNELSCPVLLILREPIHVLDSLFDAQTLQTKYLVNEYEFVKQNIFLNRYVRSTAQIYKGIFDKLDKEKNAKLKIIGQKYITIILIQKMFEVIAQNYANVLLMQYEDIVSLPNSNFAKISDFFVINYQSGNYDFSKNKSKVELSNPYSITRDTSEQGERPLKSLEPDTLNFLDSIKI